MSRLFSPLTLRGVTFRNRVFVSPMCQYSSEDGLPNDWHLVHLGSRAVGGAGLVMTEATAVSPEGRISPQDLGIWSDAHVQPLQRVAAFVRAQGAAAGVQLAHAGRKASTDVPWKGSGPMLPTAGGWETLAPSAMPFSASWPSPRAMSPADLAAVREQFVAAARRALAADFEVVELHAAHGYLLHQFLSPLANQRDDGYGGSFANRVRFPLEVTQAVRAVWPDDRPMLMRISSTDWVDAGWNLSSSIELARLLKVVGVDLVDCSSGGLVPDAKIPAGPGFQTPAAAAIRREADIATAAVGLITSPQQAEQIVATGQADAVFLAREFLRHPYWPLDAARALGADVEWPKQYARARHR
jgi:2,4-dienoyl-CoA reductase-like NADH-dependent reductase (Old Yellow Enzyme family)